MIWPVLLRTSTALLAALLEQQLVATRGYPAAVLSDEDLNFADMDQCGLASGTAVQSSAALLQAYSKHSSETFQLAHAASRSHQRVAPAQEMAQGQLMERRLLKLEERVAGLEGVDTDLSSLKKKKHHFQHDTCTTQEGTPCIFGLDDRDEDTHCIEDSGYGAFGWCFTKEDKSSWGSCDELCPLFGPEKVLGSKLGVVESRVYELLEEVNDMPEKCCKSKPQEQAKSAPKHGGKTGKKSPKAEGKSAAKNGAKDKAKSTSANGKDPGKELLELMKRRHATQVKKIFDAA